MTLCQGHVQSTLYVNNDKMIRNGNASGVGIGLELAASGVGVELAVVKIRQNLKSTPPPAAGDELEIYPW